MKSDLLLYFLSLISSSHFFFFNDTATTEIYTLSLHDALPIYHAARPVDPARKLQHRRPDPLLHLRRAARDQRSEEHTSELQSHSDLVCRLLLEKKKKKGKIHATEKRMQYKLQRRQIRVVT